MIVGRMYRDDGSCDPIGAVSAGPPVIPGNPWPIVPNVLPWLEGMVLLCGALAPDAVEEMADCCAKGLGIGMVPGDCRFCPGWFGEFD